MESQKNTTKTFWQITRVGAKAPIHQKKRRNNDKQNKNNYSNNRSNPTNCAWGSIYATQGKQ